MDNKTEFDKVADQYAAMHEANILISGEVPDYFAEYKIADIARHYICRVPGNLQAPRILDFGSGIGNSIPFVKKYFPEASLVCADVSQRSLEISEERFNGKADFVLLVGNSLPFESCTFDIVFATCVFHHIDHKEHAIYFKELYRILQSGGMAFIFEHNPYNPLTSHAVSTCPFDEKAELIRAQDIYRRMESAGFNSSIIRYRIFFPRFLRRFRFLEKYMTWLPLGAQYYVASSK